MKKLWIVLLSVALVMAFAMPVSAADVKFSGTYEAQGYYDNNRTLLSTAGASDSFVWQRLRLQTDFQIQQGLSFTTRADIMERVWGASRSSVVGNMTDGNDQESENIKFTIAYLSANIWGGLLRVGYQTQAKFGTDFADSGEHYQGPRVRYDYPIGNWTLIALWDKIDGVEYYNSTGPVGNIGVATYAVNHQADKYVGAFMYDWGKGNTGLLIYYYNISYDAGSATNPTSADTGFKSKYWIFDPYVKARMGPVYFEAEVVWITGTAQGFENGINANVSRSGWEGYASLTYDFAPMYAGFTVVYLEGDDPTAGRTTDTAGAGGGTDFNPCLMLWNYDLQRWMGGLGASGTVNGDAVGISNAQLVQVFVGVKPVPKLDIKASFTVAQADQPGSSVNWQSKNYGNELDVTATYKIFDNLSYMVGFAYLWVGDWFKGTDPSVQLSNDYLITHKLTLSF